MILATIRSRRTKYGSLEAMKKIFLLLQ